MVSVQGEERNKVRIISCAEGVGCWDGDINVHQDRRGVYFPAAGGTAHRLAVYCSRLGGAEKLAVADIRTHTALPVGCLIRGDNVVCSGWS